MANIYIKFYGKYRHIFRNVVPAGDKKNSRIHLLLISIFLKLRINNSHYEIRT